jgi:hypothetical protein
MSANTTVTAIKELVAQRDIATLLPPFFSGRPPQVKDAFKHESECWEYKAGCPGHGYQNAQRWAEIAADVLAFYNTGGGLIYFGIEDRNFSYCGTQTVLDAKLFNDKIRRYTGDKFWVSYSRAYQDSSGRYLGVAVVPKHGLQILPFFSDAPLIHTPRALRRANYHPSTRSGR